VGSGLQLGVARQQSIPLGRNYFGPGALHIPQSSSFNPFVPGNSSGGSVGHCPSPRQRATRCPRPSPPCPAWRGPVQPPPPHRGRGASFGWLPIVREPAIPSPPGSVPLPGANRGAGSSPGFGDGAERHLGEADLNLGSDAGSDVTPHRRHRGRSAPPFSVAASTATPPRALVFGRRRDPAAQLRATWRPTPNEQPNHGVGF